MSTTSHPTPEHILQVGFSFWACKTLLSAIELELFTELAKHPLPPAELQGRLGLHPRSALDFFDALVATGFLERDGDTYRNTPATDLYLDKRKRTYVGGILEMCNHRLYPFWSHLTEALRTGRPQNESRDASMSMFEALYAEPARLKEFLRAMTGISRGGNSVIAKTFPWNQYRTFADVGTAQGDLAVQIAAENTHLEGIGFDLPEIAPIFEEYAEEWGVASRLRFQPGDFFKDALPKVDVITMGHILHDWGLEVKEMLIRKAYEALPEGGALIVYEAIIDDERRKNAFGLLMSLNMLIETPDGFDYTGADCSGWMKKAGFRETRVESLVGPDSMVVGVK
jgi:cyclopropane fatty-acyl-phospholipid synthase-like methyltransferase